MGPTIDTTGVAGLVIAGEHGPTEFERDTHYLYDSAGTDIEPVAEEGGLSEGSAAAIGCTPRSGKTEPDSEQTPRTARALRMLEQLEKALNLF